MPFNYTRIFSPWLSCLYNNNNLREKVKLKRTPSPQHLGMEHLADRQPHQHVDPKGKFESKHF
jgi:hypothetical protein